MTRIEPVHQATSEIRRAVGAVVVVRGMVAVVDGFARHFPFLDWRTEVMLLTRLGTEVDRARIPGGNCAFLSDGTPIPPYPAIALGSGWDACPWQQRTLAGGTWQVGTLEAAQVGMLVCAGNALAAGRWRGAVAAIAAAEIFAGGAARASSTWPGLLRQDTHQLVSVHGWERWLQTPLGPPPLPAVGEMRRSFHDAALATGLPFWVAAIAQSDPLRALPTTDTPARDLREAGLAARSSVERGFALTTPVVVGLYPWMVYEGNRASASGSALLGAATVAEGMGLCTDVTHLIRRNQRGASWREQALRAGAIACRWALMNDLQRTWEVAQRTQIGPPAAQQSYLYWRETHDSHRDGALMWIIPTVIGLAVLATLMHMMTAWANRMALRPG